ncbi:MAG TPA: TonB-dependent receptor [Ignavibacteriaceae bacterium]|nr:TonB-dependent receptor [Ignavibacteriaceae bacterium]
MHTGKSFAQTFSISGKVVDENSKPVSGVNIIISNSNFGTATDENGNYEIKNLPPGSYSVEFSAVGFQKIIKQNILIQNKSINVNVLLTEQIIESDEVVVTAGKYEQKKSELPVSAEVIHSEEFIEKNFSNLEDALRYVPGVNMTDDQISIRGSSGYSRGTGSRALLAIDGLPFYTGDSGESVWEMIPVTELERVEIIKGAASSLYGSSAIGGVINGLTREITDQPRTAFNGFYGFYDKPSYDEWDWSGERRPFNGFTLSHSNKFGNLGFNISFTRLEDQSFRMDDYFKKYIGFVKTLYNLTPVSSLTFIANTFNKRGGNFLFWKDSQNALIPPEENQGETIETNRYLFGLIFKNVLSEKFLLNIKTNYYRNHFKDSGTPVNESTSNLYRGEIQLNSDLTEGIILTTGIEGTGSTVNSTLFGNPDSYGFGSYAVADFSFGFPLKVSAGVRYDYTKLDTLNGSGAVSPKLGLNYILSENLIIRSSLGTGFRAPTLAEAFTSTSASGITVKPNPNIKSESNLTFEIGVNYFLSRFITVDFAVFQNEYYDMIEPGIDSSDGLVFFDNIVRARIQGMEASTLFNIIPNEISFTFNYTYLWARDLQTGNALRYRPRHLFYSSLDFRKWNFEFGADFRFTSEVEEIDDELVDLGIVVDGELRVPVYVTDLRLGYNFFVVDLPVNIRINMKNIFNYNYIELIGNVRNIRSYTLGISLLLQ